MRVKPYYADYANHMLRFYCKNPHTGSSESFKSRCDEFNWRSCFRVVDKLSSKDREIIMTLYDAPGQNMTDNVRMYALNHKITEDYIWNLIHDVSYRVAKMRGLL